MGVPSGDWNQAFEAIPSGDSNPDIGDDAIRAFKLAVRQRLERDHEGTWTESGADAHVYDGLHRKGSARIYVVDADPIAAWPDADALTRALTYNHDDGRVWSDSGDGYLPVVGIVNPDDTDALMWKGMIREVLQFSWQGVIATTSVLAKVMVPHKSTVLKIGACLGTKPVGCAAELNIGVNGTTDLISTAEVGISTSTGKGTSVALDASHSLLLPDDVLEIVISKVGSTTAGSDLSVYIELLVEPGTTW
jgi:hypothetical protein